MSQEQPLPPRRESREELANDYLRTLEGLLPICDKYIESTNQTMISINKALFDTVQVQSLFITFKSQAKTMIDEVRAQLQLPDPQPPQEQKQTAPQEAPQKLTSTAQQQ